MLFPSTRPDLPVTTAADLESLVTATTATEVVRAGTVTEPLSRTSEPLIVKVFSDVSDESGVTYSLTV